MKSPIRIELFSRDVMDGTDRRVGTVDMPCLGAVKVYLSRNEMGEIRLDRADVIPSTEYDDARRECFEALGVAHEAMSKAQLAFEFARTDMHYLHKFVAPVTDE